MTAEKIIQHLGLLPHPEGGYYRETYRSTERMTTADGRQRSVCTAIYYLLRDDEKSQLHRIKSDGIWHFHRGQALEIVLLEDGIQRSILLGCDVERGEVPQAVVPAGAWFGAGLKEGKGYALVSCTVAPGFDFEDFEMWENKATK